MKTLLIATLLFTAQTFAADKTFPLCITARECLGEAEYLAVSAEMQRKSGFLRASIILLAANRLASKNRDTIEEEKLADATKSNVALLDNTKIDLKDSPALASSHAEK